MSPEPVSASPVLPAEMWDRCERATPDFAWADWQRTLAEQALGPVVVAHPDSPVAALPNLVVNQYVPEGSVYLVHPDALQPPSMAWDDLAVDFSAYRQRWVTGMQAINDADATMRTIVEYAQSAPQWHPDEAGVRFSEITAEAEAEMAEWGAILRGTTTSSAGAGLHGRTDG